MSILITYPRFKAWDDNGSPLVGGELSSYLPGTSSATPTYSDPLCTIPNTNPVILDANGEALLYINEYVKLVLTDANNNLMWTQDGIGGVGNIIALGTTTLTTNLTIPATQTLVMDQGSLITIPNGLTLTINGPFQAGRYQVFNCTGTGNVVFGSGATQHIYPEWWGAVNSATVDDSAPVLAAIIAAQGCNGNLVLSPDCTYAVSQFPVTQGYWSVTATGATLLHNGSNNALLNINPPIGFPVQPYYFKWKGGSLVAKQSATNPTTDVVFLAQFWYATLEFDLIECGKVGDSNTQYAANGIHIQGGPAYSMQGTYYNNIYGGIIRQATGHAIYMQGYNAGSSYVNANNFYNIRQQFCAIGTAMDGCFSNTFYSNETEDETGYALVLTNSGSNVWYNMCIEDCNGGGANDPFSLDTTKGNCWSGSVSNNTISATSLSNWASYNDTKVRNQLTLVPLAAVPANIVTGRIVMAGGVNWDPCGTLLAQPYLTYYDGTQWQMVPPIGTTTTLTPSGTVSINANLGNTFYLVPAQNETIGITGGYAQQEITINVQTYRTNSYNLSFTGGNINRSQGVLATGTRNNAVFIIKFANIVLGGNSYWREVSRTGAM
jgi:hypothetical protein